MREPIRAPMLGKVLRLVAQPGQRVEEDETVLVIEAMKMEIEVVAPVSGTLVEVRVTADQAVEADQDLAVLETDG
ncbi:MAG TPA: acetyl-CoA carboxylase biotin carboxyl carrier protein subunit [Chloroflexota bacterium]|jgi:pyruvate carboxylase subunit B|nr:acetyl-CoA carboxylase biotin carboxyl carrier protein subunit [Chloroflexota bacterium]